MQKLFIASLFICLGIALGFKPLKEAASLALNNNSAIENSVPLIFDENKSHSMPWLSKRPQGDILLSWTEKDDQGMISFCLSVSQDQGKSFSEKKVIFSNPGFRNSRLFRAKVLAKRDGSLWAIFSSRTDLPASNPAPQGQRGGRGPAAELLYTVSRDGGTNWTAPKAVDPDTTKGLRGFFDAIVLPNDEIAVVYLKDVKGSTKHEERDLRMVLSKDGVFQEEKLLDPIVCDCCNISLLVDAKGALHVYYRDNNDDVRDIARLSSTDNGLSFSPSQIVYNDGWKIAGCPHSGAASATLGESALMAWYSNGEEGSGLRIVNQNGEKKMIYRINSLKSHTLTSFEDYAVLIWEEGKDTTQMAYTKIYDTYTATKKIEEVANAANPTGLVVNNQLLLVHEVKHANNKNSLRIRTLAL